MPSIAPLLDSLDTASPARTYTAAQVHAAGAFVRRASDLADDEAWHAVESLHPLIRSIHPDEQATARCILDRAQAITMSLRGLSAATGVQP